MALSKFASEMTWEEVLPIWWAFIWRSTLFGMIAGGILGAIGGVIVGAFGAPELGAPIGAVLGWIAGIIVSLVVLRMVLRMQFGKKALRLVDDPGNEPGIGAD